MEGNDGTNVWEVLTALGTIGAALAGWWAAQQAKRSAESSERISKDAALALAFATKPDLSWFIVPAGQGPPFVLEVSGGGPFGAVDVEVIVERDGGKQIRRDTPLVGAHGPEKLAVPLAWLQPGGNAYAEIAEVVLRFSSHNRGLRWQRRWSRDPMIGKILPGGPGEEFLLP